SSWRLHFPRLQPPLGVTALCCRRFHTSGSFADRYAEPCPLFSDGGATGHHRKRKTRGSGISRRQSARRHPQHAEGHRCHSEWAISLEGRSAENPSARGRMRKERTAGAAKQRLILGTQSKMPEGIRQFTRN